MNWKKIKIITEKIFDFLRFITLRHKSEETICYAEVERVNGKMGEKYPEEIARIGLMEENDDCIVEVYVNTDDPETIPHFHIRKYGDGDEAEWETCVKYTDAVYCPHNNLNDKLPDKEIAVALDKMLRSPNPHDPGRTYWQTATVAWNCNNDILGIELPFDLIQPDYTQLK